VDGRRLRIGVSFETPSHFLKLTGVENLRYFAALYGHETRSVAALSEAAATRSACGVSHGFSHVIIVFRRVRGSSREIRGG